MILVTVGTHNQPFDRLLKEIDRLVEQEEIKDKVIAQIGYSKYKPRNYQHFT
jgi:UDP-N-acetylglucosamine transferase subunit ALG13